MTRRARAYQARVRARRARGAEFPAVDGAGPDAGPGPGPVPGSGDPARPAEPAAGPAPASPARDPLAGTPVGLSPLLSGPVQVVGGEPFTIRPVTGAAAAKTYTCPGCLQVITPRTPHLVVWPVQPRLDGAEGLSVRRHWHRHCWSSHVRTVASGRAW